MPGYLFSLAFFIYCVDFKRVHNMECTRKVDWSHHGWLINRNLADAPGRTAGCAKAH
jgi:hypothetical protein